MSTVVVSDLRHEIDENIAASSTMMSTCDYKSAGVQTKLRIRTLPRECNPTPVPLGNVLSAGLLSPVPVMSTPNIQETRLESMRLENPFDDVTEDKLRQLTEMYDLERVTSLQISINSTKQSVEAIGELLPSLQQLRFQQSSLNSFRDLGTSLRSLRILWAMHCHISNLDGIGALTSLQELYLQHNNVSDISPLTMHDEIIVIDLECNQITDIGQIEQLAFCSQLRSLKLKGNSIETVKQYRRIAATFLPQLVIFDDKSFSDSEKFRLSDLEIDAIIQIQADESVNEAATNVEVMLPNEISSSSQSSYTSSWTRLNDLSLDSPRADESGSRLTHGTDIVFAGNVTSALRRHRHEAETGSPHGILQSSRSSFDMTSSGDSCPSSHEIHNRFQTQAGRISITDTLNRARELDTQKHKSRGALVEELKTWQLDSVGTSHVGASCGYIDFENTTSNSRRRRKGSIDEIAGSNTATRARVKRRPNTSAGVLRHGANFREAFVDVARGSSHCLKPNSRSGTLKQRELSSSASCFDILFLDGSEDTKRQCTSLEVPRKSYTTTSSCTKALGHHHDWNLDVLAPTVDLTSAKRHLPTSLTSKQQLERSLVSQRRSNDEKDTDSSGSDADDELRRCSAVMTEVISPTPAPNRIFFNVVESLNAIEKWRDELGYNVDEDDFILGAGSKGSCALPFSNINTIQDTVFISNQQMLRLRPEDSELPLGPGNNETDHQLVKLVRDRPDQLKTRDGFRSYFRGIGKQRLHSILRQAFDDQDKVQRRMQLMTSFFHHESQS